MVSLLEKLPPETIQLDPTRINTVLAPHASPSHLTLTLTLTFTRSRSLPYP